MDALDQWLNLIGVALEIAGFLIILPQIKRGLHKRIHKLAVQTEKESEGASLGIDESHEVVTNVVNHYWKMLENIAIPLIILGLFFQAYSTIIHN